MGYELPTVIILIYSILRIILSYYDYYNHYDNDNIFQVGFCYIFLFAFYIKYRLNLGFLRIMIMRFSYIFLFAFYIKYIG